MTFMELAKKRYSERFFDPRPVEDEKLQQILEAGRIVPTACNYQPQRFYVMRSPEALAKVKAVTPFHYNAPLVLLTMSGSVVLTRRRFPKFLNCRRTSSRL